MKNIIRFVVFSLLFFLVQPLWAASSKTKTDSLNISEKYSTPWVDSVMTTLSLEERVAQLLMIRVLTDQNDHYYQTISRQVKQYNLGGVAFFRGGPLRQAHYTNTLQKLARTPLLVAMDAEWGPAMRLDSTIVFPRQMTLGAISGESQVYQMGMEVGRQLRRLGVHINFAPVVDVNNNAANPVINSRSFGESRYNVAKKGVAYMQGMQDAGIIACAKHFPGHGDTDTDSHHALPLLKHAAEEIDSIHLYPFRFLIDQGLKSMMVAHLQIPSLEPEADLASTLSENIVTGLLQQKMGFKGLVITDALDMKGVSNYFEPGELELKALMAGNDILLLPEDVEAAVATISQAVKQGVISEGYLNQKVRKILYHKQQVQLDQYRPVDTGGLAEYLNNPRALQLNKSLVQAAITLVRNEQQIIPVRNLSSRRIASLSIGGKPGNAFQAMLDNYTAINHFHISKEHDPARREKLLEELNNYDLVIVGVHDNSMLVSRRYGIDEPTISLINTLSARQEVILSLFANPYSLGYFRQQALDLKAIVVAYQDGILYEEAAAQVIFGGLPARGSLPVSVAPYFPAYKSIHTPDQFRVRFADPEEVGIDGHLLQRIDSLALFGIAQKAYPGCQIAVIRNGAVVYHKAFGYHTYDSLRPVTTHDLYDLASVTKIAATTAAVMRLTEEQKLDLEQPLGQYLPMLKNTNKEKIRLRDMLAHQGKLQAWIPFYMETLQDGMINPEIYHPDYTPEFSLPVAENLYMRSNFRDTIYSRIIASPLLNRNVYRYSDLGFIMLTDIVELQAGQPLDEFARDMFYKPLGLKTMTYRPLEYFPPERIVPSEEDTIFRRRTIKGYVNDPAAAMLGGVAGHAGLFSNAMDLAVFMQMILQNGEYGGTRFLNEETVREFTTVQFAGNENRRGLGFDKPNIKPREALPAGLSASPFSYGHSGFTGTYTWVDPVENLVYVFLSNRTYPDPNNRKISELNIRTDIHQAIYNAIHVNRFAEKERMTEPES